MCSRHRSWTAWHGPAPAYTATSTVPPNSFSVSGQQVAVLLLPNGSDCCLSDRLARRDWQLRTFTTSRTSSGFPAYSAATVA